MLRKPLIGCLVLGAILAGCGGGADVTSTTLPPATLVSTTPQTTSPPAPTTAVATTEAPVSIGNTVTTHGFGPIRIEMTLADAQGAVGGILTPVDFDVFEGFCFFAEINNQAGVTLQMIGDGPESDPGQAIVGAVVVTTDSVETPSGIRVGSTEEEVLNILGDQIESSPHKYVEGTYLDFTPNDADQQHLSVRFVTEAGIVVEIRAGLESVTSLVEGCA